MPPSEQSQTSTAAAVGTEPSFPELELADWRREVAEIYAVVRGVAAPADGHAVWRERRDRLFRGHPQSPLPAEDPLRRSGLPYWPYDPGLRFELPLQAPTSAAELTMRTGPSETTSLRLVGDVRLPLADQPRVSVWWLAQYGGGLFLPLRDATAGNESYGGGRYLIDSAKGADLGLRDGRLIVDLNFLYHPSCRFDTQWMCPLAPAGNRVELELRAGERL